MSFYAFLPELVVDLLVEDHGLPVHVEDPDVVGPPEVVLDEADHPAGPLVPLVAMARALTPIHLGASQFHARVAQALGEGPTFNKQISGKSLQLLTQIHDVHHLVLD